MAVSPSQLYQSYGFLDPTSGTGKDNRLVMFSGSGAPSGGTVHGQTLASGQAAIYFRHDGTATTTIYVTVNGGTAWTAISSGTVASIGDSGTLPFGAGSDIVFTHDGDTGMQVVLTANDTDAYEWSDSTGVIMTIDTTTNDIAVRLEDDIDFELGSSADFTCVHNGTNTILTSGTGDLIVDNTLATGSTIMRLGTDTNATSFEVQNNSEAVIFVVEGDSAVRVNDSVTLELGTSADDSITHDGTNTVWTHATGDLIFDNTDVNDQIVFRCGTDTTATGVEIRNNSDAVIWTVTADGTTDVSAAAHDYEILENNANALTIEDNTGTLLNFDTTTGDLAVQIPDSVDFELGSSADDSIVHNGTDTIWTHATGDWIFDSTDVDDPIAFRLGTDTSATAFEIRNNSDAVMFVVEGDSAVRCNDSVTFELGSDADSSVTHNGTNLVWTHTTGNFTIDNTNATGQTYLDLGTDTNATSVAFRNNSGASILTVFGDSTVFMGDSVALELGASVDDSIVHDGTDTIWTHTTGDLVFDNTDADDPIVFRMGADTQAVSTDIRNNSNAPLWQVFGSGRIEQTVTTVDMAAAGHTMVNGTAGANETTISGQIWFVDPNGASVTLTLPAEADYIGFAIVINTADAAESITIKDDAGGYTVIVLDQNQAGLIACNGTVWYGFMGAET